MSVGAAGTPATTIEEAGRRAGRGLWVATRAFALAGRASARVADPARRVGLGVAARRHGGHALAWHGLLPAVPHLDAQGLVDTPAAPLARWADEAEAEAGAVVAAEGAVGLADLHDLLVVEALDLYRGWLAAAAPWTDGPERRVLAQVIADLDAMGGGRGDAGDGELAGAWRAALAHVGGVGVGVPNTLW